MLSILYNIAAFVIAIGVLVTIHEFGHYWVARKMGVKVLRFSVGFGKPLLIKRAGEDQTEYVLAAIPLGGFVKMLDEREGDVDTAELDRAFNRKSVWRRFAIVAAGPVFNFIFAIAAYYLIYLAGVAGIKPVIGEVAVPSPAHSAGIVMQDRILAVNGIETPSWEKARFTLLEESIGAQQITLKVQGVDLQIQDKAIDISNLGLLQEEQIDLMTDLGLSTWRPDIPPYIDEVVVGGAAEAAGIKAGDKIAALDGQTIRNVNQWVEIIRANPERELDLVVNRDGQQLALSLRPRLKQQGGEAYGFIGVMNRVEIPEEVRLEMEVVEQYGPVSALLQSIDKTWRMSWLTLRVLGKLVIGEASVKNLSGPITIARYAGITARIGLEQFLGFLAIISISLGVLNLLPVPVLDGGHLFYYLIEIIKGSPVSEAVEVAGQKVGLALLFGLMSLALYNDLLRLVE
ncbi:MAG: sigma E protease regulator RseP [Gammaproteobacteria bacterium]|nr:sigma E protease regulator RseP [Gammaproteobacteria bacterium]